LFFRQASKAVLCSCSLWSRKGCRWNLWNIRWFNGTQSIWDQTMVESRPGRCTLCLGCQHPQPIWK